MKTLLKYFLTALTISTNAQTIHLHYKPKGQIVKIYFDSLTIYTDTTSLFNLYNQEDNEKLKSYDLRVKNLVCRQLKENKTDTATFSGHFIPFNDEINNEYQKTWYVEWAVVYLTNQSKLKLVDKHGHNVKTIRVKKFGSKKRGHIRRAYLNKKTKEELFYQTLFHRIDEPIF